MKKYLLTFMAILAAFSMLLAACDNGNDPGTGKPDNGGGGGGGGGGDIQPEEPPEPIHQWLLNGTPNDSIGGKNLIINSSYNTFPQNTEWGHQVMNAAGTNADTEPWNICWIQNFNAPEMNELTATIWIKPTGDISGIRGILTLEKPTSANAGAFILNFTGGYIHLGYGFDEETYIDLEYDPEYMNNWAHLALVYKGNTVTMYTNGIKAGQISGSIPCGSWWNANGDATGSGNVVDIPIRVPKLDSFWIGGQQGTQHFMGLISDVRLYDKALTNGQIKTLVDEAPEAVKDMMYNEDF